jgi:hypothetical protein
VRSARLRRAAAALALAAALPAAAYILPVTAILRRMGEQRAALSLDTLDVTGTLQVEGEAAQKLAIVAGVRVTGSQASATARFLMKVPGRCRLEIVGPEIHDAQRPFVAVRDGRTTGRGKLDEVPAAAAFVRAACALLAAPTAGDASRAYAAALARRGVTLQEAALGRFDGRIAYVIGGGREAKPALYVGKEGFQPLRLLLPEGSALTDVRLLGWGSPTGGDWFPRSVEVWELDALRLRFSTEKATANARLPEGLFPDRSPREP